MCGNSAPIWDPFRNVSSWNYKVVLSCWTGDLSTFVVPVLTLNSLSTSETCFGDVVSISSGHVTDLSAISSIHFVNCVI